MIEMMVAIAIFAIMLAVAVLAIPNHDDRYWRDNLDQLVSSLNLAQEESMLSGVSMIVQIDALGWRYAQLGNTPAPSQMMGLRGAITSPVNTQASGFIPDVYKSQSWHKPMVMEPVQLSLGGEVITKALQIPIGQEQRKALLLRSTNGRFTWVVGTR